MAKTQFASQEREMDISISMFFYGRHEITNWEFSNISKSAGLAKLPVFSHSKRIMWAGDMEVLLNNL